MLGKRLINSNSAAAGGACTTDTLQILGDTSCIAYYKMSDATDESGSYDGTSTNVDFNVAGKFGNAGEFNGSSSQITLPSNVIGTNLIGSVSLWLKGSSLVDTSSNTNAVFYNRNPYIFIATYNGNLSATIKDSSGANTIINYSVSNFNSNDWYHISVSLTGLSSTFEMYVNGSSVGTATAPASIKNIASTALIGLNSATWDGKIDQVRIFNKALSSTEVTTLYNEVQCVPTIVPTEHFEPVIYTGNGSTQSITSLNFQTDFSWIKVRSTTNAHTLQNSISGTSKFLRSNTLDAEGSNSEMVTSYNSNGFSLGPNALANQSSSTYVAWNWKAGGAAVSNTDGTITSQVSANTDAGFSVVKSTYTSTASYTVGHGLDERPQIVFNKNLDQSDASYGQWWTWIEGVTGTNGDYVRLNGTNGKNAFSDTFTTDTTIKYHTGFQVTGTNKSIISYAFHSVDGYSKIGSYISNNPSASTVRDIYCGFTPAFVMIKNVSTTGPGWNMYDNKRPDATSGSNIFANSASAEADYSSLFEMTSSGFRLKSTNTNTNYQLNHFIFMAFAEEVFVPDNFFNDDSTLATYKLNGNADDDSGNGYNGTASNVTYAAGKFDKAAVFNGSSSFLDTNYTLPALSTYSISAWFKTSATNSQQFVLADFNSVGSGFSVRFTLGFTAGNKWYFSLGNGTQNWSDYTINALPYRDGNWHNIVTVWNGTSVKLYANGNTTPIVDLTSSFAAGTAGTNSLVMGRAGDYSGNYWNGSIDQVRIFDRALSSGEAAQLYNE